jgi:putative flippase GtrA
MRALFSDNKNFIEDFIGFIVFCSALIMVIGMGLSFHYDWGLFLIQLGIGLLLSVFFISIIGFIIGCWFHFKEYFKNA